MEFILYVQRVFNIEVEQFKKYLLKSGWKNAESYDDSVSRYLSIKNKNIQITLPATENSKLGGKELLMMNAVILLSQYIDDDVESVVESINVA